MPDSGHPRFVPHGEHHDTELVERFQRDAIPLIGRLAARAWELTRDRHDAEELLQDTMLLAFRGFGSYQQDTNLRAWLYRVMQNRWISQCRRRACRPAEVLVGSPDEEHTPAVGRLGVAVARPAEALALEMLLDPHLRAALLALHDDVRTVVYYAYFMDLPHKDIAHALGVPVGTVMSRLHRGRAQLRGALGHRLAGAWPLGA